ncbi:MAG: hypothetical protein ABI282_10620 [Candidatus Baltobacteraceae bacterium]
MRYRELRLIRVAIACMLVLDVGAVAHHRVPAMASARIAASVLPYLPGSEVALQIDGIDRPYSLDVVGPGSIAGSALRISELPDAGSATVVAAGGNALAMHRFRIAAPPDASRAFVAVAAYDDGVVLHDATAPFAATAVLGIGGAPTDVALDIDGRIAAGNTSGDTLTLAQMNPWRVRTVAGVTLADEAAFDSSSHALFVTDRDVSGSGALTRILPDGSVTRRVLGLTSEGLAIDEQRHRVYVANTNDGTVSVVDANTMSEIRRFHAIDRAFSVALSDDATRLFVVSNQSVTSLFAAAGRVVTFDVSGDVPHAIARSAALAFPVGAAVDGSRGALFVTDERDDDIYVLNQRTLRAEHAALKTCRTPWKPTVDLSAHRLYVPCAQADRIDVIDTRTLRRLRGAPFATGGYPLAVAVWHPGRRVVP